MRRTVTTLQEGQVAGLPRGWIILGLAAASWLLFAMAWVALSQLFGFVASAI